MKTNATPNAVTDVALHQIRFIKKITVGTINPQAPFANEAHDQAITLLNRCLQERPRGYIIGRDVALATFQVGEHQLTMQQTTYHVGFERKPTWL